MDTTRLKTDVCGFLEHPGDDVRFGELALRMFRWHLDAMPKYRAFCLRRAADPSRIDDWRKIPPLPVEAFRYAELSCSTPAAIAQRFSTSGTSGQKDPRRGRGVAAFDRAALDVMDVAIRVNAARHLFPDQLKCRIFVLAPRPEDVPHMIMAHGMRHLMSVFGDAQSAFVASKDGLDVERLLEGLASATSDGVPVCLIGASFAFVNLLDGLAASGRTVAALPKHSRIMDAGGYKNRSRELTPEVFRELVGRAFGVPDSHLVNLLGMTELASQIYDNALSDTGSDRVRCKTPPAWVRTRVVSIDDQTVDAKPGELGFLVHYDLANFSRPLALISDDLGYVVAGGFNITSRVKSSEPRGCSVSLDELWRQA